jgi:hypothetical protein
MMTRTIFHPISMVLLSIYTVSFSGAGRIVPWDSSLMTHLNPPWLYTCRQNIMLSTWERHVLIQKKPVVDARQMIKS